MCMLGTKGYGLGNLASPMLTLSVGIIKLHTGFGIQRIICLSWSGAMIELLQMVVIFGPAALLALLAMVDNRSGIE